MQTQVPIWNNDEQDKKGYKLRAASFNIMNHLIHFVRKLGSFRVEAPIALLPVEMEDEYINRDHLQY